MTGTVTSFDKARGWGFVHGEEGRRYFVHRDAVTGPALVVGERVAFEPQESPRGPRAVGVRRRPGPGEVQAAP